MRRLAHHRHDWLCRAALAAAFGAASISAAPVAHIRDVVGRVEVGVSKSWRTAQTDEPLRVNDQIRTGQGAHARIDFEDAHGAASATKIYLFENSQFSIEQFEMSRKPPKRRTGFVDLLRGMARTLTKGWGAGSVFSARTGSVVCGIRGSEVLLTNDRRGAGVVMLGGDVFTFQSGAGRRAAEVSKLLAASPRTRGLPENRKTDVLGFEVRTLGRGYSSMVTQKPGGTVLHETVLAPRVVEKIHQTLERGDADISALADLSSSLENLIERAQDETLGAPSQRVHNAASRAQEGLSGRAAFRAELRDALKHGAEGEDHPLEPFLEEVDEEVLDLEEELSEAEDQFRAPQTEQQREAAVEAASEQVQELRTLLGRLEELRRALEAKKRDR